MNLMQQVDPQFANSLIDPVGSAFLPVCALPKHYQPSLYQQCQLALLFSPQANIRLNAPSFMGVYPSNLFFGVAGGYAT